MGKIIVCSVSCGNHPTLTKHSQVQNGAKGVQVGKIIALLAEEGDDISNLEVPKESEKPAPAKETSSSSPPPASPPPTPKAPAPEPVAHSTHASHPTHSRPLFPSVYRLLVEKNVTNPSEIKGTGIRGMLTKGDVLAHLGLASGPLGTFKESPSHPAPPIATKAPEYQVCHLVLTWNNMNLKFQSH